MGKTINEKATHGLVFMFHSLTDKYTQPIGVFASKGPVDGILSEVGVTITANNFNYF